MMAGSSRPIDLTIVQLPLQADFIVDDIVDSGDTRARYEQYAVPFLPLVDKRNEAELLNQWVVFPWEKLKGEEGPQANVTRLLQYINEKPEREGLKETPARVIKSYDQLFAGYKQDPADVMKVFEDGACDEMVLLRDIEFYSMCEHHMLPFFGRAHIAYIPNKKVLGVSKLARVLDIYARRLQIQERLTGQVTDALMEHLKPKGAACVLEAKHFCMVCRGVEKQNSQMVTSSLQGAFKTDVATRAEFFSMIKG
jgi:GTP cyclohydrolase I